ncbi:MAG: argininosuccinate synthase [Candidatus Tectomicrobia bacterium]|nr:argininosuccinate synthase [Candidatus Tectomicrobia bacterium]
MRRLRTVKRIVLAYSGGLDTSVIMRWLIETYHCEVIAFVANLGQEEDLDGIRAKALRTGAVQAEVVDVREEFVRDFVFPALRANAVYEGTYLLGTSLARPLIAKTQIEVARRHDADAVSHGATGKGNDQVRFEVTYQALRPELHIVAPWREWNLGSRDALMAYAEERGIPVPTTKTNPYSIDRNLLHCSYEGGPLEDPWFEPEASMFTMTVAPEAAPATPRYLEIDFERGTPTAIDGTALSPAALLAMLNRVGGEHGVGRVDMVENRYVGIKCRGVYETPGGTILHVAHRAIESMTMDREVMHLRDSLVPKYAELIYYGYWFAPEREMLQAAIEQSQESVTGRVRLKLYKGSCAIVGRRAEKGLYRRDYATFESEDVYNQADATGFIRLNALRLKIRARRSQ